MLRSAHKCEAEHESITEINGRASLRHAELMMVEHEERERDLRAQVCEHVYAFMYAYMYCVCMYVCVCMYLSICTGEGKTCRGEGGSTRPCVCMCVCVFVYV